MTPARFLVGIDVGGTFTDVTAVDETTGRILVTKVPSRPDEEASAVLAGLAALAIPGGDVRRLVHGTTVGTNAVLERRGARVALITTAGFRDLLEIGRTKRNIPVLFVPRFVRPRPVVPRSLRFEVDERTGPDGRPLRALTSAAIAATLEAVGAARPEAVAICLLHAYASGAAEAAIAAEARLRWPDVPRSLSSEVVPEYREFERFSTTVLNAYLQPLMERYLTGLEKGLIDAGYRHGVLTVGSSGGMMTVETARRLPIKTIFSGPAGGVSQACFTARLAGVGDFISYDMGGTSTDVCLVQDGTPVTSTDNLVGAFPVKVPQIDIRTVGAGGGSVAWIDVDGSLQVGPRSAGARPGPAAYGLGGREPTVTDANVVLGRIAPGRSLGGAIRIDASAAAAVMHALAASLAGLTPHALAEGILRITAARMTSSIREISIQRGHDPRAFTLIAFGGAGPMHATAVAEELGIPRILVPRHPGNFSALGLLASDVKHDDVRTRLGPLAARVADLGEAFAEMETAAHRQLDADGFEVAARRVDRSLDLRYRGQAFEINVPVPPGPIVPAPLAEDFHRRHLATYGHADPTGEVEVVNARIAAYGLVTKPEPPRYASATVRLDDALMETRDVWFDGRACRCPVYERERLPRAATLTGPAIVDEFGATTVIAPRWRARVDDYGNLLMERE